MSQQYIGIEIGGTKLQLVAGEADGKIIERRKFAVDRTKGAVGIRHQIELGLRDLLLTQKAKAVGVGFGGPVDWKAGKICRSHHIEGWSDFELGKWLQELAGAPVIIDNDGNVAALGEARHGAGVGFNPVFYVTLGSGVGAGLVVDGRIYHGAMPGEAELACEHAWIAFKRHDLETAASRFGAIRERFPEVKTGYSGGALALRDLFRLRWRNLRGPGRSVVRRHRQPGKQALRAKTLRGVRRER